LHRVISRLAELEVFLKDARELCVAGATKEASTLLERQLGRPEIYWRALDMSDQVAVIIDVLLQAMANAERFGAQEGVDAMDTNESGVLKLLEKGKTPIGHWLVRMQKAASCSSLSKLSVQTQWNADLRRVGTLKCSKLHIETYLRRHIHLRRHMLRAL